jgi:hypothetical protein
MNKTFSKIKNLADFLYSQKDLGKITITVQKGSYTLYSDDYSHEFHKGNQDFFAEIGINRMGNDIHEIYYIRKLSPSEQKILREIEEEILFWGKIEYIKK